MLPLKGKHYYQLTMSYNGARPKEPKAKVSKCDLDKDLPSCKGNMFEILSPDHQIFNY